MKENYELQTTLRHKNNFIKRQQYRISSLENKAKMLQAQLDQEAEFASISDEHFKLNSDANLEQVKAMKDQIQGLKKKMEAFQNSNRINNENDWHASLLKDPMQLNKDFLSWAYRCPVCNRHRDDILSWAAFNECKHGTCYECIHDIRKSFSGAKCPICFKRVTSIRKLSHETSYLRETLSS